MKLKTYICKPLILFLLTVLLSACSKDVTNVSTDNQLIANVGNLEIKSDQIKNELLSLPGGERRSKQVGAYQSALDRMIDLIVVEKESIAQGIPKNKNYTEQLELIHARAKREERELMQKLLFEKIQRTAEISDKDLQAYYEKNKNRFLSNRLHLRRIVLANNSDAESIYARVNKGEIFSDLAGQINIDSDLLKAKGDMGPLLRNEIPRNLRAAAFTLRNDGEVSKPFLADNQWNLLQLVKKEMGVVRPLENVKQQLVQELRRKKAMESMQALLDKRRDALGVEVDKAALAKLGPLLPDHRQTVRLNMERDKAHPVIRSGH